MTTADPDADTAAQLAEALSAYMSGSLWSANEARALTAALVPTVDRIVIRALLSIREAHDRQCSCDPDEPCRVRAALTVALRAQP